MTDGRLIDDYYIVVRDDFVLVIAVQDDALILVRQYRPATNSFYISVPAGYLLAGEGPESAAQRELLEETGYSVETSRLIGVLHPLPGYIRSTAHIVLCMVSKDSTATFDSDEIEQIEHVAWDDALNMISSGEISEMQTVSAVLLARRILDAEQRAAEA
jgi:ADP-ribose pyrophosphatase